MYCTHCGNKIEIDSKFCSSCGAEVTKINNSYGSTIDAKVNHTNYYNQSADQPRSSIGLGLASTIVAGVVWLFLSIIPFCLFFGGITAIILGIFAIVNANKNKQNGYNAKAQLVLGIIGLSLGSILFLAGIPFIFIFSLI